MVEISTKWIIYFLGAVSLYLFLVDYGAHKKTAIVTKAQNQVLPVSEVRPESFVEKLTNTFVNETVGHTLTDVLVNTTQVAAAAISGSSVYFFSLMPVIILIHV